MRLITYLRLTAWCRRHSVHRMASDSKKGDLGNDRAERLQVFSEIMRANFWGTKESLSGPGSTSARAAAIRDDFLALVRRLGVRTLLDAPCGDFHWMAALDLPVEHYIGVDIVPAL